jgi:hypothetical protein
MLVAMLHYGEPQVGIGIAFLVLALVIATVFVIVASHTTAKAQAAPG